MALITDKKVEVLKDITVPDRFYRRVDFGVPIMNEIFGGQETPGIVRGTAVLFTGMPGAGKSTMALQISDLLQKHSGQSVLYNVGEENRYMVKMRADRLGLTKNFCLSQFEDVEQLRRYCDENGVEVLVQDSLQSLRYKDLEGNKLLRALGEYLVKWKEESDITAFFIGHITKGGEFAGPMSLKHDLDIHMHLKCNKDTGNRVLELLKNRNGPATIPYEFPISASGIDFQNVQLGGGPDDLSGPAVGRQAARREETMTLIKEKLLAGEKVSGYCFERFEIDCSGGYWRGMLAKATKALEAEGHRIGTTRNGPGGSGREHVYVEV